MRVLQNIVCAHNRSRVIDTAISSGLSWGICTQNKTFWVYTNVAYDLNVFQIVFHTINCCVKEIGD